METLRIAPRQEKPFLLRVAIIEDTRLSFRARGMLTYLLTRSDDYDVNVQQLVAESPTDGRDAVRSTLIELEKSGYVLRRRRTTTTGRQIGWETLVFDTPQDTDNYAKRDLPDQAARRARRREEREVILKDYPKIFVTLGRQHGFRCQQCPSVDNLQIDHIRPLSKGGKSTMDNLQLLCEPCNTRKGARQEKQGT